MFYTIYIYKKYTNRISLGYCYLKYTNIYYYTTYINYTLRYIYIVLFSDFMNFIRAEAF